MSAETAVIQRMTASDLFTTGLYPDLRRRKRSVKIHHNIVENDVKHAKSVFLTFNVLFIKWKSIKRECKYVSQQCVYIT